MLSRRLAVLKAYRTETSDAEVRLSSNELPYDPPPHLREKALRKLSEVSFGRYPDPAALELREAVAEFFGVAPENILLGNGSDELIYYLSMGVGELGDALLVPVPTFPMYEVSADALGRPKILVELDQSFDLNLQDILKALSERKTAMAFYSYPNNPTGNLFSRDRIESVRDRGIFTVVDEAYYHYCGETFLRDALSREDTVVLRTLSKIGLAGLRVGILIGKESIIAELNKLRLPFNITYPSQVIASVMLREGKDFIEDSVGKVIRERERLKREMEAVGVEVFPSKANFLLFRTPFEAKALHGELLRRGVLVRDMSYMPRLERCLRVSVGKPEENDRFLEALYDSLKALSP